MNRKPRDTKGVRVTDVLLVLTIIVFYLYISRYKDSAPPSEVAIVEAPEFSAQKIQYIFTADENKVVEEDVPWHKITSFPPQPIKNVERMMSRQSFRTCVTKSTNLENDAKCDSFNGKSFLNGWNAAAGGKDSKHAQYFCKNSPQQVACFDSPQLQRFCVFDNSALNFSKLIDIGANAQATRVFEPGFLSTACADEDLKEVQDESSVGLGKVSAKSSSMMGDTCDILFREPVLVYGHSNSYKFPIFLEDSMNIMSILSSLQILENVRDITLINIDNIAQNGKLNNDKTSSFFQLYKFRRVIGASELKGKNVCFKKLISPSYPVVPFVSRIPNNCSAEYSSDVFQRWNILTRHFRNSLNHYTQKVYSSFRFNHIMQITLIYQSKSESKNSFKADFNAIANGIQTYYSKQLDLADQTKNTALHYGVTVKLLDLDITDFKTQTSVISNTSILIGADGPGIISGALLPIGTSACCGLLAIGSDRKPVRSYVDLVSMFGIHTKTLNMDRIVVKSTSKSDKNDSKKKPKVVYTNNLKESIDEITSKLDILIKKIHKKNSCISPSIAKNPFVVA